MPSLPVVPADAILEEVQAILRAADLDGIEQQNIKVREMPKAGEELDVLPCVLISPYGDIDPDALDMEGGAERAYTVEICLVDASNGDLASDRKKRQRWHSQTLNAIEKDGDDWRLTLPSVPSVWSIQAVKAPTFDRSKLPEGYAYFSVVVKFLSSE